MKGQVNTHCQLTLATNANDDDGLFSQQIKNGAWNQPSEVVSVGSKSTSRIYPVHHPSLLALWCRHLCCANGTSYGKIQKRRSHRHAGGGRFLMWHAARCPLKVKLLKGVLSQHRAVLRQYITKDVCYQVSSVLETVRRLVSGRGQERSRFRDFSSAKSRCGVSGGWKHTGKLADCPALNRAKLAKWILLVVGRWW